jgi:RNA polymerase sigma-70 factor (ECF subfamily)
MNGPREPCPDEAIARAAKADPVRFELLYDRYVESVYKFCRRRLGDETAAEDAASLVFLKAFEALPRFDPARGGFRAWLFTIAFTVVMDHQRARLRRPEATLEHADCRPADEATPEERLLARETQQSVSAAVASLSEEQRLVVELRLAGLSGAEISAVTGRSHGAVRSAQHRALRRLRELLQPELEPEPPASERSRP